MITEETKAKLPDACFTCRNYSPGFKEVQIGLCRDLDIPVRATDGENCSYFRRFSSLGAI